MKLAYVVADRGIPVFGAKGASVHVREMVNALAGLDHDLTLLAARCGPQDAPLDAQIVKVCPEQQDLSKGQYRLEGDDKARERERYSMHVSNAIQRHLLALHAEQAFDLVYERYALFSTAGVRAARELGIPCAIEVNSPLILEQKRFRTLLHIDAAKAVEAEVFSQADALFAVSAEVKAYARTKGANQHSSIVLPNGVDIARFHPGVCAAPIDGLDGRKVIGFVGSLKPWHGLEILMDAFRRLARERDRYHLLIVGDGPLRAWVEGYLAGAGLEGHYTITGWIAHETLPAFIQAMDVAVSPYPEIEDFYFSPLKLYEYMAMGKAVVCSRLGQIAELIDDGVDGILVQAGQCQSLAAAIKKVCDHPSLQIQLGCAAAQKARRHTWRHAANTVIDQVMSLPEIRAH